jgi:nucleotide-binding universal stress UspA family protein
MGIPEIGIAYAAISIESLTNAAQASMDDRVTRYRDRNALAPTRLEVGDARDIIDAVAQQIGADLVVMGTHRRRGIPARSRPQRVRW